MVKVHTEEERAQLLEHLREIQKLQDISRFFLCSTESRQV